MDEAATVRGWRRRQGLVMCCFACWAFFTHCFVSCVISVEDIVWVSIFVPVPRWASEGLDYLAACIDSLACQQFSRHTTVHPVSLFCLIRSISSKSLVTISAYMKQGQINRTDNVYFWYSLILAAEENVSVKTFKTVCFGLWQVLCNTYRAKSVWRPGWEWLAC